MSLLQNSNAISSGGYNITDSLRLRSSASAYLSRTPTTAGSTTTGTISTWFKIGSNTGGILFEQGDGTSSNRVGVWVNTTSSVIQGYVIIGGTAYSVISNAVLRDYSAWYHVVLTLDTTNSTAGDRLRLYLNGERIPLATDQASSITQNQVTQLNGTGPCRIGYNQYATSYYFDGYMAEFNLIDGQALTPSDFGETNADGVWSPKEYEGTYGTNGFYLPMKETTQVTGFNTLTYQGNGTSQVLDSGFSGFTDLIWIKDRGNASNHILANPQIGHSKYLSSNTQTGDTTDATTITGFNKGTNALGIGLGSSTLVNGSGRNYVAWCWGGDAGTSTVSNTDGTITSTVRANPATGFSTVRYTGNGSLSTVGHGLTSAPKMIIVKDRSATNPWAVYHADLGVQYYTLLNTTDASYNNLADYWSATAPSSTVFGINGYGAVNTNGNNYIAYCFSEVAGFSKFGSYTGNGSTSGPTVTTGFRPAFVMVKRTDTADNWHICDNTRSPDGTFNDVLRANLSNAESANNTGFNITYSDTGFTLANTNSELNASGGTYIYMAFADTRDYQWNFDNSGNKNNWTPNNINSNASSETTYDLMSDVPSLADEDTSNFCTLNPLVIGDGGTMSDGNLTFTTPISTRGFHAGTIGMTSGKWYWEVTCSASTYNTTNRAAIGYKLGNERSSYVISGTDGDVGNMGFYTGDTVAFAFDADNGTLENFLNGVSNATYTSIDMTKTWFPIGADAHAAQNGTVHWNFGQRPFKYTPPTGYKKLNTFNLTDSSITDGSKYFDVSTWSGVSDPYNVITKFSPDLVWFKGRDFVNNHNLIDTIRGNTKRLASNLTDAESTVSFFDSFNSDGYTVSGSTFTSNSIVGWSWRGSDSTAVSNTDGTITSTVSANPTSGFSVVTYTGNGTNNASVGHGLGNSADVVIVKQRDGTYRWITWHSILGNDHRLHLDGTEAYASSSLFVRSANTTTFTLGTAGNVNGNGSSFVAYCFAEVEGFSKFGSYTGNGSTDGPFVYTGFRPAFVLFKRSDSTGNWYIFDVERNTYNLTNLTLFPNLSNAESLETNNVIDILSNGFKHRATGAFSNASGGTYIYMAFAETPFKNSLAR